MNYRNLFFFPPRCKRTGIIWSRLIVQCLIMTFMLEYCFAVGGNTGSRSTSSIKNGTNSGKIGRRRNRNNGQEVIDIGRSRRNHRHSRSELELWIDSRQVRLLSGYGMEIQIIAEGHVLPFILDPNFDKYLPVIPSDVNFVNFTWRAGDRKYFYHFDRLHSFDESILLPPIVSVDRHGRIPRKPKSFTVHLPCSSNNSGIVDFTIGLLIESRKGKPLAGTPFRLKLRKECMQKQSPDPDCDRKCSNGGICTEEGICRCPKGYMPPLCQTALCFPACQNNGICTKPGVCECPENFHGLHCEGGICSQKCLNKGRCIGKDLCLCPRGYYGGRCEYSKCMIPCLNGGRCIGINLCKCPSGFVGDHCEISLFAQNRITQRHLCTLPCNNGICDQDNKCKCNPGFYGRRCTRRALRV